jgi:hypothetical protein
MKPRKEVLQFAEEMENKLRQNDHKGHWLNCRWYEIFPRIMDERDELLAAIKPRELHTMNHNLTLQQKREIISECADIANFAMMVADIVDHCEIKDARKEPL